MRTLYFCPMISFFLFFSLILSLQYFDTVGWKGIRPVQKWGWRRWALVSPDGVAPSQMVSVSLLIFHCTIKSRSFLLAPAHPGGPGKTAIKRLWWCGGNSQPSQIGCLPYFHTWCGLSANLGCRSETCCMQLAENTGCKKSQKFTIWATSYNFVGLYLCN